MLLNCAVESGFQRLGEERPGPFKNEKLVSGKRGVVEWQRSLLLHMVAFLLKEGAELVA